MRGTGYLSWRRGISAGWSSRCCCVRHSFRHGARVWVVRGRRVSHAVARWLEHFAAKFDLVEADSAAGDCVALRLRSSLDALLLGSRTWPCAPSALSRTHSNAPARRRAGTHRRMHGTQPLPRATALAHAGPWRLILRSLRAHYGLACCSDGGEAERARMRFHNERQVARGNTSPVCNAHNMRCATCNTRVVQHATCDVRHTSRPCGLSATRLSTTQPRRWPPCFGRSQNQSCL